MLSSIAFSPFTFGLSTLAFSLSFAQSGILLVPGSKGKRKKIGVKTPFDEVFFLVFLYLAAAESSLSHLQDTKNILDSGLPIIA